MQPELIKFPVKEHWAYEVKAVRQPVPGLKPVQANQPEAVFDFLKTIGVADEAQEVFIVLVLNTKNFITGYCEVSRGLVDRTHVACREVFRPALINGASKIIVVHNHPSGVLTPSHQDRTITNNLQEAGELLGVEVIDHLIVGYCLNKQKHHFLSFRQEGFMSISKQQAA
ncbi:DNA repair protein RadC [Lentisphaera araneosa HTCC2155]|uniref:DNA repair protein RadC n=1 Tax=Lentisphaera araneosa HTCC2155 TaxID=313628 RepID=A6DQ92_9BACT|nr:JAB domain-containing protein [Lentisphaera araneosa]EDM26143.1 DNA repair protein RadC [Lentisphaera araneosa HTCC2155]